MRLHAVSLRFLRPAIASALAVAAAGALVRAADLEDGFRAPPESTKPWCYWYWISDNVSKEGISRDLEAMARVGIGEGLIGNIFLDNIPAGPTKVLSPEWWGLVEHAIREGARTGVNIGMFNCPGWSQSGGPWVKPEQAMRYLVASETRVTGPARFSGRLPAPPQTPFQDVAVLAFPAPRDDADRLAARRPALTCTPAVADAARLADGNAATAIAFPGGAGQGDNAFVVDIALPEPLAARSLALVPGDSPWAAQCELQAPGADGAFRTLCAFRIDRSNMSTGVGFMPRGPVAVSFPATVSARFRLRFTRASGRPALAEIELSGAARLDAYVEKQLGKMHPTPLPLWDTYRWPTPAEPDAADAAVAPARVVNLTAQLAADGTLTWDVPPGEWVILRTGMTPTGMRNAPASPEGQGLEIDKMNRPIAQAHFNAFIGEVLRRMPAADRRAFKHVVADSYEMGSQNWTDGFADTFRTRYGYDPLPWLPVLTGRLVGSADQSERFLWDLRRLVADHVAADYVGGLRDACRPHGLQLWLENYGHWGFPAEFLQYGRESDCIGGEFWVTGDLGSIELRAASSAANTFGKPVVSAEAFTGGPAFQNAPAALKARGDWAFCEGINHFVLHVCIQQPWEDRRPGVNAWFGTEFNRHNTWFEDGKAWVDYLRRCCFLLQQGTRAADVAYFIGEDAPKMTGIRRPELPPGHDFDYINAQAILDGLAVRKGRLTLPHGTSYRLLVLPPQDTMRPEVLRKLEALVRDGATIVGPPPARSPSLQGYPGSDAEIRRLSAALWGEAPAAGAHAHGKGRVLRTRADPPGGDADADLRAFFDAEGVPPDFASAPALRYTHRTSDAAEIYFVANPKPAPVAAQAAFRVDGRAPELWWPDSGRIERAAVFDASGGQVRLPLSLGPHGSVFVVFREKARRGEGVVRVTRGGATVLAAGPVGAMRAGAATGAAVSNDFAFAVWARPAADTTLVPEANAGIHGMGEPRNDALFPPHGETYGGGQHAGCGLAIGRNGVAVFEHSANYFSPPLVHAAALADWTHVAVVYRGGQPTLYLNGARARQGLKSRYIVHPAGGGSDGGAPFKGALGPFEWRGGALSDDEVAAWVRAMPRPAGPAPEGTVELARDAHGGLRALAWQAGDYALTLADGRTRALAVAAVPAPVAVEGPWDVRFAPVGGAPAAAVFETLADWTERPEDGIRHYAGKATYRRSVALPPPAPGRRTWLDLGQVRDLAVVRVNGRTVGTLWMAPWRIEITDAVRAGANEMEIDVVNVWNNRLVGDRARPPGERTTYLAAGTVGGGTPLLPAGLLGPVAVRFAVEQAVDDRLR